MTFASPVGTGPEPHSNPDEPETKSPGPESIQRAFALSVAASLFILTEKDIVSPWSRSSATVSSHRAKPGNSAIKGGDSQRP